MARRKQCRSRIRGIAMKHSKALGRFAVNKVMNALIAGGYRVCEADYTYDLVVETADGFRRVEVKTGTRQERPGLYQLTVIKGGAASRFARDRRYTAKEIDFLVAYVQKPGANTYFVFPPSVFTRVTSVFLSIDGPCRWEKYREAWHLIGAPVTTPLFTALFGNEADRNESRH